MGPIRIAIIGLSSTAKTSWASIAHLPYLLSHPNDYIIVALCNSSVAAAKRAIVTYDLPNSTKAYGSPNDLANDLDIDMVACCTRVDTHYELIRPSIEAGKHIFVEWPLCANVQEARDLLKLSREKNVKTIIGLQNRENPSVLKTKSLLDSGKIGNVLSSSVVAYGGTMDRASVGTQIGYFMDRKVGGNIVMIGFAHMFDYVQSVLGHLGSSHTRMQLQRPRVPLIDPASKTILDTVDSDVPDLISLHGTLEPSSTVVDGATLSILYRRGQSFLNTPAFIWHIYGEKGELRLTSPNGANLRPDAKSAAVTIDIHDFESDTLQEIPWHYPSERSEPITGRDTASVYQAFAQGRGVPNFENAVRLHDELNAIWGAYDEAQK